MNMDRDDIIIHYAGVDIYIYMFFILVSEQKIYNITIRSVKI